MADVSIIGAGDEKILTDDIHEMDYIKMAFGDGDDAGQRFWTARSLTT